MPMLKIKTNLDASTFDEAFLKEMTTTMAGLVGKPEQVINFELIIVFIKV